MVRTARVLAGVLLCLLPLAAGDAMGAGIGARPAPHPIGEAIRPHDPNPGPHGEIRDPRSVEREALRELLARENQLTDIDSDRWTAKVAKDDTESIEKYLNLLRTRLPGSNPKLSFFLDQTTFRAPLRDMR